jgi:hypothetical protein
MFDQHLLPALYKTIITEKLHDSPLDYTKQNNQEITCDISAIFLPARDGIM